MLLLVMGIDCIHGKGQVNHAEWRTLTKRVTAEYGSDLSLSCTIKKGDSDETVGRFVFFLLELKEDIGFRSCNGFIRIARISIIDDRKLIGSLYFSTLNR